MKPTFDIRAGLGHSLRRALKYSLALLLWVAASTTFAEEDYSAGWGPEVGAPLPLLAAPDQSGRSRD